MNIMPRASHWDELILEEIGSMGPSTRIQPSSKPSCRGSGIALGCM